MGRRRLERMALAFAAAMTGALVASAPSHALSHTFDAGNLTIIADADETAEVACVNNEFILNLDVLESVSCDQVVTLQVNGGAGSNVLSIEAVTAGDFPQLTARTVFGGDGSDTVVGSPGDDDLDGGGGDDTLVDGKAGNDTITGGTGNDAAGGGDGDDEFIWNVGDGVDIAVGDGGTDRVAFNGNGDPDWLTVRPGVGDIDVDRNPPSAENPSTSEHVTANLVEEFALTGNGGADTIAALPDGDDNQVGEKLIVSGGAGNDTITGGDGNDTLSGGSEVDTITGGAGDDVINGDLHNDTLNGGEGADEIHGGQTNDTITGGPGDDELFGDGQDDTFIWNVGDGVDTVDGQGQHDTMQVNGDNTNEDLRVKPDENESLHAGVERNSTKLVDVQRVEKFALNGNDGNDVIVAEPGILAQEDSSTVVAGLVANGGAGEDDIAGGDGADSIQGGPGSDTIDGRAGNDAITWDVGDGDDAGVNGGDGADNALVGGNTDHETFTLGGDTDINVSRSAESQDTEQFDLAAIEKVTLDAGAGDDLISGGTGLAALGAETHISGGEGNDNIDGTDAADVIAGGTGVDTVAAAAGDDVLVWSAGDGADQSTDGGTGDDRAQVGGNANEERFEIGPDPIDHGKIKVERFDPKADIEADETLLYDGIERYDLSGNNGGDTLTAAADLETILTMSGGAGQDTLEGSDGTDTLRGDEANDTLEGNGGADTLTGGEGSDTLLGGAGDDVLVSTASSPANNDTVEGGDGDDTMSHGGQAGNQEWNSSVENVNGKDVLKLARTGPPGSILVDGVESLSIDLGSGDDRFFGNDVDYAALGVQRTSILGSSGNDETTGTNVTDQIVGDTGNDTLDGAGGNDVLSGGAGSDTIAGGDGDDTLLPGGGSGAVTDAIDGNDGDDTLQLVGSDADDTFVLEAGGVIFRHTATGTDGDVSAIDIECVNVLGNGGEDTITGSAGYTAFDTALLGGDGNDTITGTDAADTITGDAGDDEIEGGVGSDTIDGGAGGDVIGGGAGNDLVNGDGGGDSITGGAGADTVRGGAGADTLTWNPGDGSDVVDGDAGTDLAAVNGSTGADEVVVSPNGSRVKVAGAISGTLGLNIGSTEKLEVDGGNGNDELSAADGLASLIAVQLAGGGGADTITGGNAPELLSGGGGNDTIIGGAGSDTLNGDAGNDSIGARDDEADQIDCGGNSGDSTVADAVDTITACKTVDLPVDPTPPPPEPPPPPPPPAVNPAPPAETPPPVDTTPTPTPTPAPTPTPTPPAATGQTKPAVTLAGSRLSARRGAMTARVRCPRTERSCRIALRVRNGRRTVGSATRTVSGGRTAALRIRLDRRTRRSLRGGRSVRLTGVLTATDATGNQSRRTVRLTVRNAR